MTAAVRSLLFVCTGNICRSPLAEGIFRARAAERALGWQVASAATHAYHVGQPPDPRACAVARRHGIDLGAQRARHFAAADWSRHARILVADRANLTALHARFGAQALAAERLLDAVGMAGGDVPDPYYGDDAGFEQVFCLLDAAIGRLLQALSKPA